MKLELEGIYTGYYGNKYAVVRFHADTEYGGRPLTGTLSINESALLPHVKIQDQERILNDLVAELSGKVNGGGDACAEGNAAKEK